ncbi:putative bifunctional diguanylate cyclase/phosphodiesterase [Methylocystis heyeri]|uniref:EAL domain-containing protein n=1 Tax=Methylocystis heyeri TaxID=391905 RepID=A0A6B8KC88_9HYPH|nr:bifunctional diguanylate cyclase/phosphodiesterase [Methylocystis heyeri]QGM44645.1 EAL domain-containing protein [Methylocystis heyeri]
MLLKHLAVKTPSAPKAAVPEPVEISPEPQSPDPVAWSAPSPDTNAIVNSIGDLVYEWDLVSDRLVWGENLARTLGPLAESDLSSGMAYAQMLSPESTTSRYDAVVKSGRMDEGEGVPYQVDYALSTPRDASARRTIWIEDTGRWFRGEDGRPLRAHGVVRVITERHQKETRLAQQTQFDPLTGVFTRAHLCEQVRRIFDASERTRKPFAILLVALENLFGLNRTYGYDAGDEVIAGLAKRLSENLRANDMVARHAGNKFAVVLQDCDAEQLKAIAIRMIEAVAAAPFETSAGPVPATVRIGGVVGPREGRTTQALFQHAEEALDVARQRNGERFVPYTASLAREDSRIRALQMADNIVSALNERRVELAFQPIVHAGDGQTAFYEALLRVRLGDGSVVTPGSILPVAEKAGLVRLLDQRVLELALVTLSENETLNLSVNASLASILDPDWPDRLSAGVQAYPGVAQRLTIEITETSVIEDIEATSQAIASCKRLGVHVAMDDFGAGHTSFRNLRALAFDLVKIDGAFVENIVNSEDDRFFVRTLIDLARHLDLKIVAEWVKDEETAGLLRGWGVDYFQGSLFGSAGPETSRRPSQPPSPMTAGG